jgi:type IX secretion system substrate protein
MNCLLYPVKGVMGIFACHTIVKPSRLSFYNSDGRMLWQKQFNAGTEQINVNGYSKGSYLLKAGDHTEKVIIF